jgi:hypothetical protein
MLQFQSPLGEMGKLESFDLPSFRRVVDDYLHADEVERALWLLDNLPGKYRDFPPTELVVLKQEILGAMFTAHTYMTSDCDGTVQPLEVSAEHLKWFLRGRLVLEEVSRYNAQGLRPHIIDVGPGEYFIPLGLKHLGKQFTYWDVAMDRRTGAKAHPELVDYRVAKPDKTQPVIFVALEIIEHLPSPKDLLIEALKHGHGELPERVHISTPCYTFDGSKKDWRKPTGLPHLRTYTPREFLRAADDVFPGYQWDLYQSEIQSLRGCRTDKLDAQLFTQQELEQAFKR